MQKPVLALASLAFIFPLPLSANPSGEQVVAGQASVSRAGSRLTVHQASERAIINWQDFSISAGNTTSFVQPSVTSATLNRVISGNPSAIHGRLQATGQVYLINPNGILVGPGGVIDTAGFVASTLDVSDEQFLSGGDLKFKGNSAAAVVNLGQIGASEGDVILVARTVENYGEIKAPRGTAALAAGGEVLVKASGEERVFVQPESGRSDAQVNQAGKIRAATAEIKAAGGNEYSLAIRHSGETRATGVTKQGGRIFLSAGGKGGISHSGRLIARKNSGTSSGGTVKLEAQHIELAAGSEIDTSAEGKGDGGEVLIGGGYQGSDPSMRNAETVTVEAGALIISDAASEGQGGRVIVWSDDTTVFGGTISARGGTLSGDGGFAEVSGKNTLSMIGRADLRANAGRFGTLLLDPGAVSIVNGPSAAPAAEMNSFNDGWIVDQLGLGNLTITTDASTGGGNATITVAANVNITWAEPTTLTLEAGQNIAFASVAGPSAGYTGPGRVGASRYTEGATVSNSYSGGGFDAIVLKANLGPTILGGTTGIHLQGVTFETVGGNIEIVAKAASGSGGAILASHGSLIQSTGSGNIHLDGQGGNYGVRGYYGESGGPRTVFRVTDGDLTMTGIASDGGSNARYGLMMDGVELYSVGSGDIKMYGQSGQAGPDGLRTGLRLHTSSISSASTGSIELEGIAGSADSYGLHFTSSYSIVQNGTGNLIFKGQGSGAAEDIYFAERVTTIGGANAKGDITMVADSILMEGGTLRSTGVLEIRPRTSTTSIGIAGGAGNLALNTATLDRFYDGFETIIIGAEDGSGAIEVGSYTFKDDLIIRTPTGNGDITVKGALATGSGSAAGTITLQAGRSIIGSSGASITTQGKNIVLNADRDQGSGTDTGGGNIHLTGTAINSNGGAITLGGGVDPLTMAAKGVAATSAATKAGIYTTNTSLSAGAGTISLRGEGLSDTSTTASYGVNLQANSQLGTTSGDIVIHGAGGNSTVSGSKNNHGVGISGATTAITSATGSITITGEGGQSELGANYGIIIQSGANVVSTDTATITLDGTGGVGATWSAANTRYDGYNYGVYIPNANTLVTSVYGDITITAQGGSGLNSRSDEIGGLNRGMYMVSGSKITSTGVGANAAKITIHSTGGSETERADPSHKFVNQNMGVYFSGVGTEIATVDGDIKITGIGLPGTSNYGVFLHDGFVTKATGSGDIHYIGEGSTAFTMFDSNNLISIVGNTGDITIEADNWASDGAGSGEIKVDTSLPGALKGRLIIQPHTAGTAIGIAGGAGKLSLTATRLAFIKDGFSEIVIGNETAGKITSNAATFTDPLRLVTAEDLALNGALNVGSDRLVLLAGGNVTQTAPITAGSLRLGGGGNFTLENVANSFTTLAKDGTGSVSVRHNSALSVGSVDGVDGVAGSTVDLRTSAGNLTLDKAVSGSGAGNAVVLSTPAAFVNNAGPSAISTPAGRWLVYSNAPEDNTFGGLLSGQTALWNHKIGTNAPSSITQGGNRYLFVTQPSLTVEATLSDTKIYGETYTFPTLVEGTHYTISGFVDPSTFGGVFLEDSATTIGLTGAPSLTSSGTAASAAASGTPYIVNIGAGTLANTSGYLFGTYTAGGGITVTPRTITVTADSGQTKIYGDADPSALTFTIGGLGLASGDGVTDALTGALARASGENVGSYAINQGTLTATSNYSLTFTGANFGITPRAVTVTADLGQNKTYGDANPSTYSYTHSSLGAGVALVGALTRAPGEDVGSYAITQGTLTDANNSNYNITYVGSNFDITQRAVTITVTPGQGKIYGAADPLPFQYTHTSLGMGAPLTGVLSRQGGEQRGLYAITRGSLTDAANPNYAITYVGGDFKISEKALHVVAGNTFRFVHQPNPPLSFTIDGFHGSEGLADLEGSLDYFTEAGYYSRPGAYTIYPQGIQSNNYHIAFSNSILTVIDNPLLQRDLSVPNEHFNPTQETGKKDPEDKGKELYEVRPFPSSTISSLSSGEVAAE